MKYLFLTSLLFFLGFTLGTVIGERANKANSDDVVPHPDVFLYFDGGHMFKPSYGKPNMDLETVAKVKLRCFNGGRK